MQRSEHWNDVVRNDGITLGQMHDQFRAYPAVSIKQTTAPAWSVEIIESWDPYDDNEFAPQGTRWPWYPAQNVFDSLEDAIARIPTGDNRDWQTLYRVRDLLTYNIVYEG